MVEEVLPGGVLTTPFVGAGGLRVVVLGCWEEVGRLLPDFVVRFEPKPPKFLNREFIKSGIKDETKGRTMRMQSSSRNSEVERNKGRNERCCRCRQHSQIFTGGRTDSSL